MNTLIRWNPVRRNLLNEFDRLFDTSIWPTNANTNTWGVALDVTENEDAYKVKASVPGMNPDDIELTLEDNVLTVKGEVKSDEETDEEHYHIRERRYGSFSRTIRFPMQVDGDKVQANYEQGVLTLTVPKAEIVKPKRISIKANAS